MTDRLPAAVVRGPSREGPPLAVLLHRVAQTPADLLDDAVSASAALADLAVALDGSVLDGPSLDRLDAFLGEGALRGEAGRPGDARDADATAARTDRRALALLTAWLLGADEVRTHAGTVAAAGAAGGAATLVLRVVEVVPDALAGLRAADEWVADPEAREELVRAVLAVAGLRAAGEHDERAADAWAAVSTRHRRAVVAAMAVERQRAEELARRLAEKRAKEAAAQYVPS